MLWGKNMPPASQQRHPTTMIIGTIIPSNPTPITGKAPAATFLPRATPQTWTTSPVGACQHAPGVSLLLPETQATCLLPLRSPYRHYGFSVGVCVCLFAQLVLCSLYRQHQPNPTAVLSDGEPMCNEGPTLRCENKLQLSMSTAPLPPPFLSVFWIHTHAHTHTH